MAILKRLLICLRQATPTTLLASLTLVSLAAFALADGAPRVIAPSLMSALGPVACRDAIRSIGSYAPPVTLRDHAVRAFAVDVDDNILFLPTKIYIFKKNPDGTRTELAVSTGLYAQIHDQIGISGDYKDYYQDFSDPVNGTMRRFGDQSGPGNAFLEDLKWAVENQAPDQWQGPAFKALVHACSSPETSAALYLITARHHEPEKLLEGLEYLKNKGFIAHVPKVDNIFPVSFPGLPARLVARWPDLDLQKLLTASTPEAKSIVMSHIVSEIQSVPVTAQTSNIIDQDGNGSLPLHTFGFSDDDYGNYTAAVKSFEGQVATGKIKNVKITVFFTGLKGPIAPTSVVITSEGTSRARSPDETTYSQQMLSRIGN